MTISDFDHLLERREQLRARHEELCQICNEDWSPLRPSPSSPYSGQRDRVYAEIEELDALVEAELEAERAAEAAAEDSPDLGQAPSNPLGEGRPAW